MPNNQESNKNLEYLMWNYSHNSVQELLDAEDWREQQ